MVLTTSVIVSATILQRFSPDLTCLDCTHAVVSKLFQKSSPRPRILCYCLRSYHDPAVLRRKVVECAKKGWRRRAEVRCRPRSGTNPSSSSSSSSFPPNKYTSWLLLGIYLYNGEHSIVPLLPPSTQCDTCNSTRLGSTKLFPSSTTLTASMVRKGGSYYGWVYQSTSMSELSG